MRSRLEVAGPDGTEGVFEVRPFTSGCERLLDRRDHALIGISAGNGYFSRHRLTQLLEWTGQRFASVDLLYADLHIDAMHRAAGADPDLASRRTARSLRDVRRRIRRAMEAAAHVPARVRSIALSETVDLPGYRTAEQRIDRELTDNPQMRRACEEHVRRIVGQESDPKGSRFRAGMAYLRAELPYLLSTPEVLSVPSSVCCYHGLLPVLVELREDTSCFHPRQGHLVLRPLRSDGPAVAPDTP